MLSVVGVNDVNLCVHCVVYCFGSLVSFRQPVKGLCVCVCVCVCVIQVASHLCLQTLLAENNSNIGPVACKVSH